MVPVAIHLQGALALALLAGCTGEPVAAATSDATVDGPATDSGVPDGNTDAPPDGGCPRVPGNLVTDGDFNSGLGAWIPDGTHLVETSPGRCGQAIRVYDIHQSGRIVRTFEGVPFLKGTKLHVRAWFKKGSGPVLPVTPSITIRSYGPDPDGGEMTPIDFAVAGNATGDWRLTERVITLTRDQSAFQVFLELYLEKTTVTYDYLVDDVSVVVEP